MARKPYQEQQLGSFSGGINNVAREDQLEVTQLRKALNVDILPGGALRRRAGYSKVLGDGRYHSLFTTPRFALFVKDGTLQLATSFESGSTTQALLSEVGELAYVEINNTVFFSDGKQTGCITEDGSVFPIALSAPPRQPFLSPVDDGGLFAGVYQVAITYVSADGAESGTGKAAVVQVAEGGGILLESIPQPEEPVAFVRVYMTDPNGEALYFRTQIPVGVNSYEVGYFTPKKKLDTQFLSPIPPFTAATHYRGRLYVTIENVVVFSSPLNFGLHDITSNYILFPSKVRGIAATEGGLFVSDSEQVYFLRGSRPEEFNRVSVETVAAQRGTMTGVDGAVINDAAAGKDVAVWWSERGYLTAGFPDGSTQRVQEDYLAVPQYAQGAISEVEREGVKQLVSVMKNPGMGSATAFEDSMTIEVHKNGVQL